MCRAADLERGVMFQYDPDLRRVRPLGVHQLASDVFGEVYVDPDTASFVRDALERDEVVERAGDPLMAHVPSAFAAVATGRRVVCVPMIAAGRWVGLLLADRSADTPPLTGEERGRLWTLGKGVALATMARRATRKDERTRTLRARISLARDVHDTVVQRLFGVAMALEGAGDLPAAERQRCADEVQQAMGELRQMVRELGTDETRLPEGNFDEELARWAAAHRDLTLDVERDETPIPDVLQGLAVATLAEALRNARKHARPTRVVVRTRRADDALVLEIENDGRQDGPASADRGAGLRLLGIQALHAGGVIEFGARGADAWQVRLVVPLSGDE
ncbi:MAG: hypothetical protein JHD16_02940 [Solirubrobacteraceae bacterium]|nr:hypothetical protein [Solirubrobacteraceae bacterium]